MIVNVMRLERHPGKRKGNEEDAEHTSQQYLISFNEDGSEAAFTGRTQLLLKQRLKQRGNHLKKKRRNRIKERSILRFHFLPFLFLCYDCYVEYYYLASSLSLLPSSPSSFLSFSFCYFLQFPSGDDDYVNH